MKEKLLFKPDSTFSSLRWFFYIFKVFHFSLKAFCKKTALKNYDFFKIKNVLSFTQKYEKSSEHIGAFVKESLGEQGPTYALRVAQSQSCIAANKDGFLSLRPFERIYPHPDTIFVLSKV